MPAAAVSPAPIAYIQIVAVKKLVVASLLDTGNPRLARVSALVSTSLRDTWFRFAAGHESRNSHLEENSVFTTGRRLE